MLRAPELLPRLRRAATWALCIFGSWTFIFLLDLTRRYSRSAAHGTPAPTPAELWAGIESIFVWTAFTPVIFALARRWPITRQRWATPVAFHVGFAIGATVLDAAVVAWVAPVHALPLLERVAEMLFPDVFGYLAVLGVGLAIRFHGLAHERTVRAAQLETQLADARLEALEMQLRPHFLFNTLHTINALVREGDSRTAVRVVASLGDLLRALLERDGAQEVPLRDELALVERYIDIERVRFHDRLSTSIDVDADVLNARVPRLILQPLVENAVRHGVEAARSASVEGIRGRVAISACRDGDTLRLTVRDDGAGPRRENPSSGRGIGIANTVARLRHLYGERHSFELTHADGGGALCTVTLPLRQSGAEAA